MLTIRSQSSRVRRRNPDPSAPSTQASGPDRSASNRFSAPPASAPISQTPRSLSSRSVRARLVMVTTGTVSAAPRRGLGDRRVDADGAVLRHDHRVRAECIGAAQACAQVVRIGDAVEHQQQRRFGQAFEDVVERLVLKRGVDLGHDTLVPVAAGHRIEALILDRVHDHACAFRALDQLARPPVAARGDHVDRAHAVGRAGAIVP